MLLSTPLRAGINFIEVTNLNTYEKMLELARTTKKDIFVFVDDINCTDCKKLEKQTFKDKALNQYLSDRYICLSISASSTYGGSFIELYTITGVPALLVLNAYEIVFAKNEGFIDAPDLLKQVQEANALASMYTKWARGAAEGSLSKLDYIQFLLIEFENNRVSASHPIIRDVSSMLDSSDFNNPLVLRFIQELCLDIDGPVFQTILQRPNWITDTLNFSWAGYQANVYNYNVGEAVTKKDSVFLEESLLRIQQLPHFTPVYNFEFKGRQLYLAELNKWTAYDTITLVYLDELPADSADVYQREAMHLMEYYSQTDANFLALKYLRKGLARKETFKLYYTLSLWLYKSGDMPNAYKAAYTAEKFAYSNQDIKMAQQLQRWIEQRYY
jgi:hypothetical protein